MSKAFNAFSANLWSALSAGFTIIMSFLTAGLAIRFLPQADAGLLMLSTTMVTMADGILNFGLRESCLRGLSRFLRSSNSEIAEEWFSTSFLFVVAVFLVFVILSLLALGSGLGAQLSLGDDRYAIFISLMLLVVLCEQIAAFVGMSFHADQNYKVATIHKILFSSTSAALLFTVLVVYKSLLIYALMRAFVVSAYACYLISDIMGLRPCRVRLCFSVSFLREQLRYGRSILATKIIALGINGFDRILFVKAFGLDALPLYALPRRMCESLHRLVGMQSQYLFPALASMSSIEARNFFLRIEGWYSLISTSGYLFLVAVSEPLLASLVSSEFANTSFPFVVVLALAGALQSFELTMFPYANATGRPGLVFIAKLIASIITVGAMLFVVYAAVSSERVFALTQIVVGVSPLILGFLLFGARNTRALCRVIVAKLLPFTFALLLTSFILSSGGYLFALPLCLAVIALYLASVLALEILVFSNRRCFYDITLGIRLLKKALLSYRKKKCVHE